MFVCLFVCLSVSMFRMAGQTAGPIETKLDTHLCPPRECFCQGHSCMRVGVTELRNTRNAARKRHLANAAQTMSRGRGRRHLANAYETPSRRRVITARVTRRGAAGAEQRAPKARASARVELRPEDG